MKKVWCFNPHGGGEGWYGNFQLRLRFKGQFCYLDASGKDGDLFPICRLHHFSEDRFSLAFYTADDCIGMILSTIRSA